MTKILTFKHPDNEPHAYGWAEAPKYKDRRQLPGSISFPAIPAELPEKAMALHCPELPVSDAPWIDDCGDLPLLVVFDKDDRMVGAIVISMEPVAVALFAAPVVLGEQRAFDLLDGHPSFDESSVLCLGAIEVLFEEWPSLPDNRLFLFLFFVLASTPATPARGTAGRGRYNSRRLWLGFVFLDERSDAVGTNGRKREQHNRRNANESVLLRRLQWHGFGSLSRNRRWLVHLRSLAIASAAAPDVACFALRDAGVTASLAFPACFAAVLRVDRRCRCGIERCNKFVSLEKHVPQVAAGLQAIFCKAARPKSIARNALSFLVVEVTPAVGSASIFCRPAHNFFGFTFPIFADISAIVAVSVAIGNTKCCLGAALSLKRSAITQRLLKRIDLHSEAKGVNLRCVAGVIDARGRRRERTGLAGPIIYCWLGLRHWFAPGGGWGRASENARCKQRHDRAPFFPRRQSTLRVQGRRFCSYVSLPAGIRKGQVASIGRTGL